MNNIDYKLIDINIINELPNEYPDEFINYCINNKLKPPSINSGNGKALSVMLKYKYYYWNRNSCDEFVKNLIL